MAKSMRGRRRSASRQFRATPYPRALRKQDLSKCTGLKKCSKHLGKKDWEDATCSVCMEYPHSAVLLLCSSHDKGCRPYMCGTSVRYSNCLDQYKKAYTKVTQSSNTCSEVDTVLACPLCRGKVKGWTVVEPAREYLNAKKRSCMQEKCTFTGDFRELRKHVKSEHPCAKPREVDPESEQKWRSLERERERDDVISTIRSSMPGARVFGDYVIEHGQQFDSDEYEDEDEDEDGFQVNIGEETNSGGLELGIDSNLVFLFLHAFGQGGNSQNRRLDLDQGFNFADQEIESRNDADMDDGGHNNGVSFVQRLRRQGRVVLGRSDRRRRDREATNNGG